MLLLFTGARRRSRAGCPTAVGEGGVDRLKAPSPGCPFQSYRGDVKQTIHVLPTPGAANIHSLLVALVKLTRLELVASGTSGQVL